MSNLSSDRFGEPSQSQPLIVALVGNPNAGKTTLFNALTGLRQKVGNYPGVTVEKRTGELSLANDRVASIVDLPGTYSLVTVSPDEKVVSEVLRGSTADLEKPTTIVAVVDASNLARNLFLVSQLLDLDRPLVVALNMTDVAEKHGRPVDCDALAESLGCSVVPVVAHRGEGLSKLTAALLDANAARKVMFDVPAAMAAEEERLSASLDGVAQTTEPSAKRVLARRLLSQDTSDDLAPFRTRLSDDIDRACERLHALGIDPMQADIEARYRWIDNVVARSVTPDPAAQSSRTTTQCVDAVLMHRFFGVWVFAAIMTALFACVFWLAKPLMDAV